MNVLIEGVRGALLTLTPHEAELRAAQVRRQAARERDPDVQAAMLAELRTLRLVREPWRAYFELLG